MTDTTAADTTADTTVTDEPAIDVGQVYELVDIDTLIEHPANPHVGDDEALSALMKANGFYGALEVQTTTRYVIAGNTRLRAARRLGLKRVPVLWQPVDNDRALAILLGDNRSGQLGYFDDGKLRIALEELQQTNIGLAATGYDPSFLADLQGVLDNIQPYSVPSGNDVGGLAPGSGAGSAIVNPSFSDLKDQYAANGVRSLILDFPVAEFEVLSARLKTARERFAVDTNTALLSKLLDMADQLLAVVDEAPDDAAPASPTALDDDFFDIAADPEPTADA